LNWYFLTWINLLFFVCNNSVGLMVVKNWKLNIISCLTFLIFASNFTIISHWKLLDQIISFSSINFFYKIWRPNFKNRNTVPYPTHPKWYFSYKYLVLVDECSTVRHVKGVPEKRWSVACNIYLLFVWHL